MLGIQLKVPGPRAAAREVALVTKLPLKCTLLDSFLACGTLWPQQPLYVVPCTHSDVPWGRTLDGVALVKEPSGLGGKGPGGGQPHSRAAWQPLSMRTVACLPAAGEETGQRECVPTCAYAHAAHFCLGVLSGACHKSTIKFFNIFAIKKGE